MLHYYLIVPSWFKGIDQAVDLISLLTCLGIFLYSLKAYQVTKYRKYLVFSLAFLLIALSFIVKTADILGFSPMIKETVKQVSFVVSMNRTVNLHFLLVQIQRFFILLAFMALFCLSRKIESKEAILLYTVFIFIISFFTNSYFLFHFLTSIVTFLIVLHYYNNHKKIKTRNSLFSYFAFIAIFLSQIMNMFILYFVYSYVIAEFLQLIGFLFLLYTLISVRRK